MKAHLKIIQAAWIAIIGCTVAMPPILADDALPACLEQPTQDCLLNAARAAALDIHDSIDKVAMLTTLASREALLGLPNEAQAHFEAALAVGKTIEWPEGRLAAFSIVAYRQVDAGQYDHAQQSLTDAAQFLDAQIASAGLDERDNWHYRKTQLEKQQAETEAKAKNAARNRQANIDAAKIEDPFARFSERILTASSQFDSNDRVDATETLAIAMLDAATLQVPEERFAAWLEIGRLQLQLGRNSAAEDAAHNALAVYRDNSGSANHNVQTAMLALFMLGLTDQ
jgi:hypothetical protein